MILVLPVILVLLVLPLLLTSATGDTIVLPVILVLPLLPVQCLRAYNYYTYVLEYKVQENLLSLTVSVQIRVCVPACSAYGQSRSYTAGFKLKVVEYAEKHGNHIRKTILNLMSRCGVLSRVSKSA